MSNKETIKLEVNASDWMRFLNDCHQGGGQYADMPVRIKPHYKNGYLMFTLSWADLTTEIKQLAN